MEPLLYNALTWFLPDWTPREDQLNLNRKKFISESGGVLPGAAGLAASQKTQ